MQVAPEVTLMHEPGQLSDVGTHPRAQDLYPAPQRLVQVLAGSAAAHVLAPSPHDWPAYWHTAVETHHVQGVGMHPHEQPELPTQ
jgi:hypothetical protein